jgi:hypothetical protein
MSAEETLLLRAKMSEYHTGYRGYSNEVLTSLRIFELSNDFVFNNQILAQTLAAGEGTPVTGPGCMWVTGW